MDLAIAWVAALALAPAAGAQDKEDWARGQKHLDKLAKEWSAKLPEEKIVGVYVGNRWCGSCRITVKKAPPESGAAFEIHSRAEVVIGSSKSRSDLKATVDSRLCLVTSTEEEEEDGKAWKTTITIAGGKWRRVRDSGGETKKTEGHIRPCMTWDTTLIAVFGMPPAERIRLTEPGTEKNDQRIERMPGRHKLKTDGKELELWCFERESKGNMPDHLYFDDAGALVEMRSSEIPLRMRPIAESQIGKNFPNNFKLTDAENVVVEYIRGLHRKDKERAMACFDFEKLAEENVPTYKAATEEKKKAAINNIKAAMEKEIEGYVPPWEGASEDDVVAMMISENETKEQGELAFVKLASCTWSLHKLKEGDRKGKWLIYALKR